MVDTVERFEQITQDSTTDPPEESPSNPLRISMGHKHIEEIWRNNMGL